MREMHHCVNHHLQESGVRLPIVLAEGARHTVAGVVDERVDREASLHDLVEERLRRRRIGQIRRYDAGLDGELALDSRSDGTQALRPTRSEHDVEAVVREYSGELGSDPGGCSSDQGRAAGAFLAVHGAAHCVTDGARRAAGLRTRRRMNKHRMLLLYSTSARVAG